MVSEQPSLAGLEPTAIAGSAGDLIIWNSFIPHGNGANTSDSPRLAQFVTMVPADSTGNEGLDVPGIWRNGGLSYADHAEERRDRVRRYEQRAAGIGNTEMMNVYERSLPTKPARLTALGKRLLGQMPWN